MLVETLTTGARRFRADEAGFVVARVRPGVLLVAAEGIDRGQFGDAVLAELSAELVRFAVELEMFVDARAVELVGTDARAAWTAWLEHHRDRVRRVHLLSAARHVQLVASIAGHYSRTKVVTYAEPEAFEAALASARGTWPAPARADAIEAASVRRRTRGTAIELEDGMCRYELRWASSRALLVVIAGEDRGTLASLVFDEIAAGRRAGERLDLFIDLRDASMPRPPVSALWTEWFSTHRDTLGSVWILSTHRGVSLTADIARWRSGTDGLVRVVGEPHAFDEAIARVAPQLSRA